MPLCGPGGLCEGAFIENAGGGPGGLRPPDAPAETRRFEKIFAALGRIKSRQGSSFRRRRVKRACGARAAALPLKPPIALLKSFVPSPPPRIFQIHTTPTKRCPVHSSHAKSRPFGLLFYACVSFAPSPFSCSPEARDSRRHSASARGAQIPGKTKKQPHPPGCFLITCYAQDPLKPRGPPRSQRPRRCSPCRECFFLLLQ